MKKKVFFVTATNTDVGKTYACEKLMEKYAAKGYKVGYVKPIETGVENNPLDGSKLLNVAQQLNKDFTLEITQVVPYTYKLAAAPYVASKKEKIGLKKIYQSVDLALKQSNCLFIEGAGGLMVPINKDFFMIDLAKKLQKKYGSKSILISPSNLGNINETLLSLQMLQKRKIDFKWYINLHKDKESFDTITLPFYNDYFDKINFI